MSAPSSAAEDGFSVLTSPLPIKISSAPGKTIETELRIKNTSNNPEGIRVGLMKFGPSDQTGAPTLFDVTPKDQFGSWVTFSPKQFTAQPNVWNSIKMTINIPPTADLGYYMAVTFSPANQPDVPQATNLKGSAATLVLLDVKTPNQKRKLEIAEFSTDKKVYEYLPTTFRVKIHNTGNIYIAPSGNIFIKRGDKAVETLDFNSAGGSVLPDSYRQFNIEWKDGFPLFVDKLVNGKPVPDSKAIPKKDLTWNIGNASKFRFGKYTAQVFAVYDDGKQDVPIEATVSFWVLPWKIMLVVLLVIIVVLIGIYGFFRGVFRKAKTTKESIRKRTTKKDKSA
jgi:hypothetical protein